VKDNSGTITTGGSWQVVSSNVQRSWFDFQNISDGDMYFFQSFGGATPPSSPFAGAIKVPANSLYEPIAGMAVGGELYVYGATTGKAFTSREI
jgi:hypothetical protein